jgi:hypothetical protein
MDLSIQSEIRRRFTLDRGSKARGRTIVSSGELRGDERENKGTFLAFFLAAVEIDGLTDRALVTD